MVEITPRRVGLVTPEAYPAGKPTSTLETLVVVVIAIAALYFARDLFVPLALAVLLSFALGPLVMLLRRWHFQRIPSVIATVMIAFVVIFGVGSAIGTQLTRLAENLPGYQSNIADKIHAVRGSTAGTGILGRASGMLKNLSSEIVTPMPLPGAATVAPNGARTQPPIPVEIHQPDPTTLEIIETIVGPLAQPLATAGIVVVFVVFFLLQREDLRDRFIRLAGAHEIQRTTQGLDDAARRVSRYLLVQTAINAGFGIVIGLGLWFIGIPNPILWGILAMLLRFVPYIGPVIAAIFPALLAIAVDPGWSMLLWTGALFVVVEPITGQIVEPFLYGHSTGLSAVAVILAAAFWTWLWGPVGLLLSTPLTLCLVVLGRHVERLEFLDIILGDQPALSLEENFYQRMLANDPDEAAHQAEEYLKENPLSAYYDDIAIRGLALAQLDVNRGVLEHERRVQIKEAVLGVIDDLADHEDTTPPLKEGEAGLAAAPPPPSQEKLIRAWGTGAVMCVAGRGSLDEAAAAMLEQLLVREGIAARVVPSDAVATAYIARLDVTDVRMVCLSYLEPGGFTNARYLVRRLRRRLPNVKILVGFWTLSEEDAKDRDALRETGADLVVTSIRRAVETIIMASESALPAPTPIQAEVRIPPAGGMITSRRG